MNESAHFGGYVKLSEEDAKRLLSPESMDAIAKSLADQYAAYKNKNDIGVDDSTESGE